MEPILWLGCLSLGFLMALRTRQGVVQTILTALMIGAIAYVAFTVLVSFVYSWFSTLTASMAFWIFVGFVVLVGIALLSYSLGRRGGSDIPEWLK